MLTFIKATDDLKSIILVTVNLDANNIQSGYTRLPLERLGLSRDMVNVKLEDLLTGDHYTWINEWNYISIDPYKIPFQVYKLEIKESFS